MGQSRSNVVSYRATRAAITTNMKVLALFALVAAVSAAPAPWFYSGSHVIPTTYTAGSGFGLPLTYSAGAVAGSNVVYTQGSPITYSAGAPITYTAGAPLTYSVVSAPAVVPAVVPKTIAQTKGSSHITY